MTRFVPALIALAIATATQADEPGWKAGFGTVKITPTQPMWMSGYAGRTAPAEGTETDLWAKAMALEDAKGHKVVLVTLDLVGIDRTLSLTIRDAIAHKYTDGSKQGVALSVSHTHCGPVVGHNLGSMYFLDVENEKRVADYTTALPGLILKAVADAVADLKPAKLAWGTGTAGFAVNRRENKEADVPALREAGAMKGPVDHAVPVLAVRGEDGKLRGILFGYACHATVMSYLRWSGDYPGFAMIELEKTHPGTVAMFFAGCGADQNPLPRRAVDLAREYGRRLAAAVDEVVGAPMTAISAAFAGLYNEIELPLLDVPTRETLVKESTDKDKYVAARAKTLLKRLETDGRLSKDYPYPVQTWQLGNGPTLVLLGGEVVVDYSLRLKRELGPRPTWVMGYANDVMAYIPSRRVLKEGGYEGATAMVYYGLPSVWGERVEEIIVAEVHRQAKLVRGQ